MPFLNIHLTSPAVGERTLSLINAFYVDSDENLVVSSLATLEGVPGTNQCKAIWIKFLAMS